MRRPKSLEQLQKQCDDWNAKYPVGRAVMVEKDDGSIYTTRTRSRASVLSGHTAVIFVDGISGCYLLDRVKAVNP